MVFLSDKKFSTITDETDGVYSLFQTYRDCSAGYFLPGRLNFVFSLYKNPTIQHEGMYTITHIVLSGPGNDYPAGIRADTFFMI